MKAVVDRFEGELAVLLVGEEEFQVDWPRKYLPEDVQEGSILRFDFTVDHDETERVREKMRRRIERLKKKSQRNRNP